MKYVLKREVRKRYPAMRLVCNLENHNLDNTRLLQSMPAVVNIQTADYYTHFAKSLKRVT